MPFCACLIVASTDFGQVSSEGTSQLGNAFTNEYVFIFHLTKNAAGEFKIKVMKEFLDTSFMHEFRQKEQASAEAAKSQ